MIPASVLQTVESTLACGPLSVAAVDALWKKLGALPLSAQAKRDTVDYLASLDNALFADSARAQMVSKLEAFSGQRIGPQVASPRGNIGARLSKPSNMQRFRDEVH